MVVKPSLDNCPQPLAYFGHRAVHEASQLSLDLLQLGPHALSDGFAFDRKRPLPSLPALMGEAKEVERFWLAQSTPGSAFGREASEFDQARFVWMQFQAELGEALLKILETAFGIGTVLEPHDEIIRVPNDDDVALSVVFPPVLSPEVEDIVQEYVRKQR